MGLGTAAMIYGGCLYMFPSLTIASTVGIVSLVVKNTYRVCKRIKGNSNEVVH